MTAPQLQILAILALTVVLFLWGRWRHDVVALIALMTSTIAGLVPADEAFLGFGHAAVITVAAVLVLSRGLQVTGAVDLLARAVLPTAAGTTGTIAALTALGAVLSSFMNNVGAMALLMPVAIQAAAKHGVPPGRVLMPLAFGTILGGMTTLIGTPPNLIVSGFRMGADGEGFGMFDYAPVGVTVAAAGVLFAALVGWRLVPAREQGGVETFDTGRYLTEARVKPGAKAEGKTLREVEQGMAAADAQIVGMARNEFRVSAPNPWRVLRAGDVLVIEAEPDALTGVLDAQGLALDGPKELEPEDDGAEARQPPAAETELQEFVVLPTSNLIGRSAEDVRLRSFHGVNVLAISRQGRRSIRRLRSTRFLAGDVLLLQAAPDVFPRFAADFGAVPLASRSLRVPDRRKAALAAGIMALAIAGAAFGLLPAALSFVLGGLAYMVCNVVPVRSAYDAIDWSVVVLLAALIPVAGAMETTGAADVVARWLLEGLAQGRPVVALVLILVLAMTLSDFMNNAATAAVMCPIAIGTATRLDARPDSFLMAVAIGASCAFLTPIGHQNNTLILGPGGFRFADYWRLGLPMEVLVVTVGVPMLLWIWPL